MIKIAITGPVALPIVTNDGFFRRETMLAPMLEEYGIEIVGDPNAADFEVRNGVGLAPPDLPTLPPSRIIVVDGEPPQPEYLLPYYNRHGFAGVVSPANLTACGHDGLSYHRMVHGKLPALQFRPKIIQLSTFRTDPSEYVQGKLNNEEPFRWRVLCTDRCRLGLAIWNACPDVIDICGRDWPEGVAMEVSRGGPWTRRKMELLNRYGFNICWENMEIPYYVTEKLWDPIMAGSLPIYWGPPEMHARIPQNTVIDCRQHHGPKGFDLKGLLAEISSITEADWTRRMTTLREWYLAMSDCASVGSVASTVPALAHTILRAADRSGLARDTSA